MSAPVTAGHPPCEPAPSPVTSWDREHVLQEANWARMCRAAAWYDRAEDAAVLDHRVVSTVPVRFSLRGLPPGLKCYIYPDTRRKVWVRRNSRQGLVLDGQYTYYRALATALECGLRWGRAATRAASVPAQVATDVTRTGQY